MQNKMWVELNFLISLEKSKYVTSALTITLIYIKRQSVCLEINSDTIYNFVTLFKCTPVHKTLRWPRLKAIKFSLLGPDLFRLLLDPLGLN